MNFIVTGAAGFIGSHIAEGLYRAGHTVLCIDNLSGGTWDNLESTVGGAECSGTILRQTVDCGVSGLNLDSVRHPDTGQFIHFDTLVHCAANAREGASQFQPCSVTHNNAMGYANILTECIRTGVKNVVLFSSMAVYGNQRPPFNEDLPRCPVDVYGCNKSMMEHITEILAGVHEFNYTIIRPHNVFGERQSLQDKFRNVVAIFMNRIMRNEPLFIYGDGSQVRAFSYISDSLPCFLQVAEQCARFNGEIINIGGTADISINYLADVCIEAMGARPDYLRKFIPARPLEVHIAFSSYDKSMRLLNYADHVGWYEGVHKMAEWAKQRGPQEWQNREKLELINHKTPVTWLD